METACQVYTKLLSQRGHGYALWEPEPTEAGEVLIGDVGYIHDGGFYRLFNATLPEDDPVNARSGVPDGYEPFVYPDSLRHTRDRAIQPGPICSKHVAAVDVEARASMTAGGLGASVGVTGKIRFRCADEQAAVIVLKQHAVRDSVHRPQGLERYIKLNHKSWCWFARDVARISIEDEEIVFISGFVKTAQWALAAAAYHAKAGEFLFGGEFGPSAKATFSVETTNTSVMSVEQRCSGVRPSTICSNLDGDRFDQCIFVHRYKLKNRLSLFPTVLRAAAQDDSLDPPRSPPHHDDDHLTHSGSVMVGGDEFDFLSPNNYKPNDLLDGILQYILQCSAAECAIASDHDLTELFADMDHDGPILAASDIREALIAQNRQVSVTNDGVGTLDWRNHPHAVNDSSISGSTIGNLDDSTQELPRPPSQTPPPAFPASLHRVDMGFRASINQDKSAYLPGTHVDTLEALDTWAGSVESVPHAVCYLTGAAGTGKSTVVYEFARRLHDRAQLGASVFFCRASQDHRSANLLFPSLASQLSRATHIPQLSNHIIADAHRHLEGGQDQQVSYQADELVIQPLRSFAHGEVRLEKPLIIVVDALDECHEEGDRKSIIPKLVECTRIKNLPIRILLTARPDVTIEDELRRSGLDAYSLSLYDCQSVERDVDLYLETKLAPIIPSRVRDSGDIVQRLKVRAEHWFLYAQTVSKYLQANQSDLMAEFGVILSDTPSANGALRALDQVYLDALRTAFPPEVVRAYQPQGLRLRRVLCLLALLQELSSPVLRFYIDVDLPLLRGTLSPETVTSLLQPELHPDDSMHVLNRLRSVVVFERDDPKARFFPIHSSFRTFLVDRNRCTEDLYYVDAVQEHAGIAEICFSIMGRWLTEGFMVKIFGRRPRTQLFDIEQCLRDQVPMEVQYACVHWATHLSRGKDGKGSELLIRVREFAQARILRWIELLAYMDGLGHATQALRDALDCFADGDETRVLFQKALQLLTRHKKEIYKDPHAVYVLGTELLAASPSMSPATESPRSPFPSTTSSLSRSFYSVVSSRKKSTARTLPKLHEVVVEDSSSQRSVSTQGQRIRPLPTPPRSSNASTEPSRTNAALTRLTASLTACAVSNGHSSGTPSRTSSFGSTAPEHEGQRSSESTTATGDRSLIPSPFTAEAQESSRGARAQQPGLGITHSRKGRHHTVSPPGPSSDSQSVLCCIKLLPQPLSPNGLGCLLHLQIRQIMSALDELKDVVAYNLEDPHEAVRVLYNSAAAPQRVPDHGAVYVKEQHTRLARSCLRVLVHDWDTSEGTDNPNPYASSGHDVRTIPEHVQYAGLYWATHLAEASPASTFTLLLLLRDLVAFSLEGMLRRWLDTLRSMGRLDVASTALTQAESWLAQHDASIRGLEKAQGSLNVVGDVRRLPALGRHLLGRTTDS